MKFSLSEWREWLRDIALIACIVCTVVITLTLVSVAIDFHALRMNNIESAARLQSDTLSRVDSLLSKLDRLIVVGHTLSTRIDTQLTQVRTQVRESSDDNRHEAKILAAANTAVVAQAVESTAKVVEAIAAQDPPVVKVEAPAAVIQVPANAVIVPKPAPPPAKATAPVIPKAKTEEKKRGVGGWLKKIITLGMG